MSENKDKCSGCGKRAQLVNKFFKLCLSCNNIRLHGDRYGKKPKTTVKSAFLNTEDTRFVLNFKNKRRDDLGLLTCEGCLGKSSNLDLSHLIPKSLKPELKRKTVNCQLLCRACHDTWEHKLEGVENLKCYQKNLETIKKLDPLYYERNFSQ